MTLLDSLKMRAAGLKADTYALYLVARDPRTPWLAKAIAVVVVAYALSPIDLIPDFIPVLGYVDDLVLLPAGIWLALRLVPDDVMREARQRADERLSGPLPVSRAAAAVVVAVWLGVALLLAWWLASWLHKG